MYNISKAQLSSVGTTMLKLRKTERGDVRDRYARLSRSSAQRCATRNVIRSPALLCHTSRRRASVERTLVYFYFRIFLLSLYKVFPSVFLTFFFFLLTVSFPPHFQLITYTCRIF